MSDIRMKYGDGEIYYDERSEKWRASVGTEAIGERSSLKEAKRLIDQHGEEEKKFERHTALHRHYGNPWEQVTVTSYPEERGWRGACAWITRADKRSREKVTLTELREDNERNGQITKELAEVRKEIESLRTQESKLERSLTAYKERKATDETA